MDGSYRDQDVFHWQTIACRAVDAAAQGLFRRKGPFVTPAVLDLSEPLLGFFKGILVRDPDEPVMEMGLNNKFRVSGSSMCHSHRVSAGVRLATNKLTVLTVSIDS
jgi:hypothetical protein